MMKKEIPRPYATFFSRPPEISAAVSTLLEMHHGHGFVLLSAASIRGIKKLLNPQTINKHVHRHAQFLFPIDILDRIEFQPLLKPVGDIWSKSDSFLRPSGLSRRKTAVVHELEFLQRNFPFTINSKKTN